MRGPDQISSDSWWNFRLRVLVVSAFWRTAAQQRLNRTGENVIATQTPVRTPLTKRAGRRCAGHEEKAEPVDQVIQIRPGTEARVHNSENAKPLEEIGAAHPRIVRSTLPSVAQCSPRS